MAAITNELISMRGKIATHVDAVAERHHGEYNAMCRTLRRIIRGTVEEVFERG